MPLWLTALLFLVGLAFIAFYCVSETSRALSRCTNSLTQALDSLTQSMEPTEPPPGQDQIPDQPAATLGDQLVSLSKGIGELQLHLERVGCLLLPIAILSAARFEKTGWDRFPLLRRKMDEAISLSEQQKRQRKLMRDDRGFFVLVYEDEVEAALKKGWTL